MRKNPRRVPTAQALLFAAGLVLPACGALTSDKEMIRAGAEPAQAEAPQPQMASTTGASRDDSADESAAMVVPTETRAEPAREQPRSVNAPDAARRTVVAQSIEKSEEPPPPPRIATKSADKKAHGPSKPMPMTTVALGAGLASGREEVPMAGDGSGGDFGGREREINAETLVENDAQSTFAIDVDTAAYSIARRTLLSNRMPTGSLVRVEEMVNYFKYDYEAPTGARHPFSIQAEGARSPVDGSKHFLRVGIQARVVKDEDRLPANLVFLVDTSCSMTSDDKLSLAKESLKVAVEHLGEKDRVAITTYAGGVRVILPPTPASQKDTIKRAIDGLQSAGGTAMESGLTLAYKQAARMLGDKSITRIIVCSDGDANIGATSPTEMLKQVEGYVKEGVTLSTIGFGDGNYKDETMETIANKGNGNYYYIDRPRMAQRVFGRDLTKMIQDVAQDVKIQVELDKDAVHSYRLVGYENRDIADRDFRNDKVDAGEIGAGHQVTAIYELTLKRGAEGNLATIRVRAKEPRGMTAKETELNVPVSFVDRPFEAAPEDMRFAVAVMGGAELLRQSPFAKAWSFSRVISLVSDSHWNDPDRTEFLALMKKAAHLSGESQPLSSR